MFRQRFDRLLCAVLLAIAGSACGAMKTGQRFRPPPDLESWRSLLRCADREYVKMHWQGWSNAAVLYERALSQREDERAKKRLFYALLLKFCREIECQHADATLVERLHRCAGALPAVPYASYARLAEAICRSRLRTGHPTRFFRPQADEPERGEIPAAAEASAEAEYVELFFLGEWGDFNRCLESRRRFLQKWPDSNLTISLDAGRTPLAECNALLDALPDFFEVFAQRAEILAQNRLWDEALRDLQTASQGMPFWLKMPMEMARIHLILDEDQQALERYEQVLAARPRDGPALFGKGVSLSNLGRLAQANAVFFEMISGQTLYHGEAYYFLARNHYLQNDKAQSRAEAELARTYIPDSPELLHLSGTLYFEGGNLDGAEREFRRLAEKNPASGDASFYLGLIALQRGQFAQVPPLLSRAGECFWQQIDALDRRRQELETMGLSPEKKRQRSSRMLLRELEMVNESEKKLQGVVSLLESRRREPGLAETAAALEPMLRKLRARRSEIGSMRSPESSTAGTA